MSKPIPLSSTLKDLTPRILPPVVQPIPEEIIPAIREILDYEHTPEEELTEEDKRIAREVCRRYQPVRDPAPGGVVV